jgi:hypothetical protein
VTAVCEGEYEWEYAEPPPPSPPPQEHYSQRVEPTAWTPRDRSTDPHGTVGLNSINEEQIQHDRELRPSSSDHYVLNSGVTHAFAATSIGEEHPYVGVHDRQEERGNNRSSRSDDRSGRDEDASYRM